MYTHTVFSHSVNKERKKNRISFLIICVDKKTLDFKERYIVDR